MVKAHYGQCLRNSEVKTLELALTQHFALRMHIMVAYTIKPKFTDD